MPTRAGRRPGWPVGPRTLGAALIAIGSPLGAQSHYWSDHFGNESILLNGAVIGSVTDAGAVFYNPARLVHQRGGDLLASAKVYEWTRTEVRGGLGTRGDLGNSRFGGVPSFVVGSFSIPGLDDHSFAYGFLTRHRARFDYSIRGDEGSALPLVPPPDLFVGFIDYEDRFKDDWLGVSWAHAVSTDLSFGASIFYYDRDLRREASVDLRGVDGAGNGATLQAERSYRVQDKGLVGKAGVSWRSGGTTLGASITLPYWSFSSKGSIRYDDFVLGLPDSTGAPSSELRSMRQSGLPVDWRAPWSVGFGVGWASDRWQLHSAVEFFASVPHHTVLQSDPSDAVARVDDPVGYRIVDERKSVVNVGGGIRWNGSDRISLFGSVATNFSAAPDSLVDFAALDTLVTQTNQEANMILVGGGVSVRTPWVDLTVGATWQGGNDDVDRSVLVPGPGGPGSTVVHFEQWRFLAGFSVPAIDEFVGDVTGRGAPVPDPPPSPLR